MLSCLLHSVPCIIKVVITFAYATPFSIQALDTYSTDDDDDNDDHDHNDYDNDDGVVVAPSDVLH